MTHPMPIECRSSLMLSVFLWNTLWGVVSSSANASRIILILCLGSFVVAMMFLIVLSSS